MAALDPQMTPDQAVGRDHFATDWKPGQRVWATWSEPPSTGTWVPGTVARFLQYDLWSTWEVDVEAPDGQVVRVNRDPEELLPLREIGPGRRAVLRKGPGLVPGTCVYEIQRWHDGHLVGKSLARGDEIEEWKTDLRDQGYTVEDA